MSDNEAPTLPELTSFRDLPEEGDTVFQIHETQVRFTSGSDSEGNSGWLVTTAHPGYLGFLKRGDSTVSGAQGVSEPFLDYVFRLSDQPSLSISPTPVTVGEFKRIYFGDPTAHQER